MNTRHKLWLTPPTRWRGATIDAGFLYLYPSRIVAIGQARRLRSLYRHYRRSGCDPQIARLATIGMFADGLIWEGI